MGAAPRDPRSERLAAALRENLRKRKQQARGRELPCADEPVPAGTGVTGPRRGGAGGESGVPDGEPLLDGA